MMAKSEARQPISPSTRRSNTLYWAKELLGAVAIVALLLGVLSTGSLSGVISSKPLPAWAAAVAIPSWLLARALREFWRRNSDEHEQRASDFGRNAAGAIFLAVTPAWWVAARAGLAPQPDAMALWVLAVLVSTIGWAWRRYN